MGRVERLGALPGGIGSWALQEAREVHEQHAAAMTDPAERLASCAARLERALQDVEEHAGQLPTKRFADQFPRLASLTCTLSEMNALCVDLFERLAAGCEDIKSRQRESSDYRPVLAILSKAKEHVQEASVMASSLAERFERMAGDSAARERPT